VGQSDRQRGQIHPGGQHRDAPAHRGRGPDRLYRGRPGPGIPEEALRHIFDKFYQADTAHRQEGNGLGLALVEKILELEKGTVAAEDLPEGGCRFTVTLRRDTGT
jgi:light-regulated signal transduction histidine kinase (bacteriophytochrome)